jgi:hypothetical protein
MISMITNKTATCFSYAREWSPISAQTAKRIAKAALTTIGIVATLYVISSLPMMAEAKKHREPTWEPGPKKDPLVDCMDICKADYKSVNPILLLICQAACALFAK